MSVSVIRRKYLKRNLWFFGWFGGYFIPTIPDVGRDRLLFSRLQISAFGLKRFYFNNIIDLGLT